VAVFLQSSVHKPLWRRLFSLPQTGSGWLSAVLAAVFVVLFSLDVAVFLRSPGVEPWLEAFFGIVLLVYGLAELRRFTRSYDAMSARFCHGLLWRLGY
jgi:hypothetical protein